MKKAVLLDGALGTNLWEKAKRQVPVWRYNIEEPEIVAQLHREYAEAGSQIVLTNTFSANRFSVKDSPYTVKQVMTQALEIIHGSVDGLAKTALSVGPLSELLEPYGDLTEADALEIFDEQISYGAEGKPDIILLETFMDIEMLKIAVRAALRHGLPVFCTMSFDRTGHTIMGNTPAVMAEELREYPVSAIGLNCSLGPDLAVPVIRQFKEFTDLPLIFKPNAGKPSLTDGRVQMQFDTDIFVSDSMPALDCGVKYIGGCCGSNPQYIRRLREAIEKKESGLQV